MAPFPCGPRRAQDPSNTSLCSGGRIYLKMRGEQVEPRPSAAIQPDPPCRERLLGGGGIIQNTAILRAEATDPAGKPLIQQSLELFMD